MATRNRRNDKYDEWKMKRTYKIYVTSTMKKKFDFSLLFSHKYVL